MTRDRRRNLAPVDQPLTDGELADMEHRSKHGWNVSSIDVQRAVAEIRRHRDAERCESCDVVITEATGSNPDPEDPITICDDCAAELGNPDHGLDWDGSRIYPDDAPLDEAGDLPHEDDDACHARGELGPDYQDDER